MALLVSDKDAFEISVIKLAKVKALSSGSVSTGVSKLAFLYLNAKKMLASFVSYKIWFARLCARLTMNYELLTALCDTNWYQPPQNLACSVEKYVRMHLEASW